MELFDGLPDYICEAVMEALTVCDEVTIIWHGHKTTFKIVDGNITRV